MNRVLALLPLVGLCAAFLPQDPPPDDEAQEEEDELQRDIFGRLRTKKVNPDEAGLEGMWQLLAMELEGYPDEGLSPFGYLLIHDGFLAFEMQAFYDDNVLDDDPWEDGYQTFMAEYDLIGGDQLRCRTLIGSYLDEEEDILDFEPAGMEREFNLKRTGKLLTLEWGDGDWMTFGRRLHTNVQLKDAFGRRRGSRSKRGPDIFGREKTGEEEAEEAKGGGDGDQAPR